MTLQSVLRLTRLFAWRSPLALVSVFVVVSLLSANPVPEKGKTNPVPKKDEPAKKDGGDQSATPALPNIPPGADPEQVKRMRDYMRAAMEQQNRMMERMMQARMVGFAQPGASRLGASVQSPSDTLTEQLDLPKGKGLVVLQVEDGSAAAKAGLKSHDILLQLDGKDVPSDAHKFLNILQDMKANAAMDAVVLRKGKKETIKGLSLPVAKAVPAPVPNVAPPAPPFAPRPLSVRAGASADDDNGPAPPGALTTTLRTSGGFRTAHQEGPLSITVTGKVKDGKAAVTQVQIKDGKETSHFDSVEKVPERYRDKVKKLVEAEEKEAAKAEIKPGEEKEKKN